MIVGNGDIASVLPNRNNLLFFASGVSNSQENRETEYARETKLLLTQDVKKHIVYFSSLCIFYSDTRYAHHKREMEQLIKVLFRKYTIIRIGNIDWGNNPHTLINSFREKIKNRQLLRIDDAYRYIVGKEEFLHWIDMIPEFSCEMNIPGRMMLVKDVVKEYCYGK